MEMPLLSDKQIDDLFPTKDEIDLFLAEPTPPDELNQYFKTALPPEIKKRVAYGIVHCRKVAKAQRDLDAINWLSWFVKLLEEKAIRGSPGMDGEPMWISIQLDKQDLQELKDLAKLEGK